MRQRDTFFLRLIQTDEKPSGEKTAERTKEELPLKIFLRSVSTGEEEVFDSLDALNRFLQQFLQLKMNQQP
ncbi:MAG: hypothetical protein SNJ55_12095 [Chloroherpetonaceae bacterium]